MHRRCTQQTRFPSHYWEKHNIPHSELSSRCAYCPHSSCRAVGTQVKRFWGIHAIPAWLPQNRCSVVLLPFFSCLRTRSHRTSRLLALVSVCYYPGLPYCAAWSHGGSSMGVCQSITIRFLRLPGLVALGREFSRSKRSCRTGFKRRQN